MNIRTKILTTAALLGAMTACDKQRDLYVEVSPAILVEGDWVPSLNQADMSMNATATAWSGGRFYSKEYFHDPAKVTIPVEAGTTDIMIFNGLMYGADDTHLDGVFFRNIDRLETFEAVAVEAEPIKRMGRAEGEYIATNNMEIFTSMTAREQVDADGWYFRKYRDGENQGDIPQGMVDAEIEMTPVAMSYEAQIVVELENISSAYGANAALRGFTGSAFVAERMPSHFLVTHQFNLNNKRISDEAADTGTIESPVFVTFGPPLDMPDNRYEVYVRIVLVDGEIFETTVDVTDQVIPIIEEICRNMDGTGPVQNRLVLKLDLRRITLPDVEPVYGSIGVGDWEDDEIIKVPITP